MVRYSHSYRETGEFGRVTGRWIHVYERLNATDGRFLTVDVYSPAPEPDVTATLYAVRMASP
jgi:hypothetical protein